MKKGLQKTFITRYAEPQFGGEVPVEVETVATETETRGAGGGGDGGHGDGDTKYDGVEVVHEVKGVEMCGSNNCGGGDGGVGEEERAFMELAVVAAVHSLSRAAKSSRLGIGDGGLLPDLSRWGVFPRGKEADRGVRTLSRGVPNVRLNQPVDCIPVVFPWIPAGIGVSKRSLRSTFYPRRRQGPRLPDRMVERRRARATCPAGRSSKPSPGHRIASARRRCAASPRRQPLDLYLLRKQVFNGFLARRTGSLTVGRVSGQSKTWPASRDLLGCSALQPCRLPAPNKRAISFGHVSRQACVKDAAPSFCTCF